MKNSKSFTLLITVAFACVMSCNEQDEKLEEKNLPVSKTSINSSSNSLRKSDVPNFDGSEGDPIDLVTAKKWISNFRNKAQASDEILAHYFGFEIIQNILNQSGCVGIRIYYATNDAGTKQLLLVGVDAAGEDLLPSAGGKIGDDGNIIADASLPCPDYCAGNGL